MSDTHTDSPKAVVQRAALRKEDFICPLCLKLLCRPSTTTCGHSFCQSCLQQFYSIANQKRAGPQCPLCRAALPSVFDVADVKVSVTLEQILQTAFPSLYEKRIDSDLQQKLASQSDFNTNTAASTTTVPVFVLDPMLPGQVMTLNVFEARYLTMIGNALQTPGRKFGMVGTDPHRMNAPRDHGVEVVIEEHENVTIESRHRMLVKIRATRAFRVLQYRPDPIGFPIAQVEMLDGDCLPVTTAQNIASSGSQDHSVIEAAQRVRHKFCGWHKLLVDGGFQSNEDERQVRSMPFCI